MDGGAEGPAEGCYALGCSSSINLEGAEKLFPLVVPEFFAKCCQYLFSLGASKLSATVEGRH